jgi:hypothetical protein
MLFQGGANGDHGIARIDGPILKPLKKPDQWPKTSKLEIVQLLRKRRMHFIEVSNSEEFGKENAKETGLFMGVEKIVTALSEKIKGLREQQYIQKKLR